MASLFNNTPIPSVYITVRLLNSITHILCIAFSLCVLHRHTPTAQSKPAVGASVHLQYMHRVTPHRMCGCAMLLRVWCGAPLPPITHSHYSLTVFTRQQYCRVGPYTTSVASAHLTSTSHTHTHRGFGIGYRYHCFFNFDFRFTPLTVTAYKWRCHLVPRHTDE